MSVDSDFQYVRKVDLDAFENLPPDQRLVQKLLDPKTGAKNLTVGYSQTPPGGGSRAGLHVHDIEQLYYIVKGTMTFEIEGDVFEAGPGSLIVFPPGVAHRNWNNSNEPTVQMTFESPVPDPNKEHSRTVG